MSAIPALQVFSPLSVRSACETIREAFDRYQKLTVQIVPGFDRSAQQNRLSHQWYSQISIETGEGTAGEIKAHCKLHHGVPILRAENPRFCEVYDRCLKHLEYADKLALMDEIIPVTSLMTTDQFSRYLETMQRAYANRDTDPVDLRFPGDWE